MWTVKFAFSLHDLGVLKG
jgi:hypothetical protein